MYGRDLTELARIEKLDPVIGREKEIEQILQVLGKNNPLLLGEAGVGKTAILHRLAQLSASHQAPEMLRERRFVTLDLALSAISKKNVEHFRGEVDAILTELCCSPSVILVVDGLSLLLGANETTDVSTPVSAIMAKIAQGELPCITTSTPDEFRRYAKYQSNLEGCFQPIEIHPTTKEDTLRILRGLRDHYAAFHRVSITDNSLSAAVELADRYLDGCLPDKALRIMDVFGIRMQRGPAPRPPEFWDLVAQIERFTHGKEEAVAEQDFDRAVQLRDEVEKLKKKTEAMIREWEKRQRETRGVIDEMKVAALVSTMTGVPLQDLNDNA
jgi:ATP-dependent Clp protease ATP-binding subunit ClpC